MDPFSLLLGLALGFLAAWFVWIKLQQQVVTLKERQARLTAEIEAERRATAEKLAVVDQAELRLRDAFAALSAEALKSNNEQFLDLAKTKLGEFQTKAVGELDDRQKSIAALLQPIEATLGKVDSKLQEVERQRTGDYASLTTALQSVTLAQQTLQAETTKLVQALRTPHVRGRWGEIQLRRVVELADMVAHCDFIEQPNAQTEDGRLTPDMIVRLPGGKNIIVDAKAPLAAYLDSVEAADHVEREARLRDHARQVRDHMVRLGTKAYWDQFQPAPEFVFMFLPGETFFSAALQHDPSLIEFGVANRVIPASPITLIALLRSVAYGWRQEKIAENAQAISSLGRELYDRVRVMATHLDRLGSSLDKSVEAYNQTVRSMESRVMVTARRFRELGVSAPDDLPDLEIIERAPQEVGQPDLLALSDEVEPV